MRRWLPIAVMTLWAATASAHTFGIERSAVLQIHTSHAELLLLYAEPPGPRTERLLALYDQNRNGEIDGVEERLARRAFLQRAFYGLEIEFGARSAKKTAELRFKRDERGGVAVAVLQRFDLVVDKNELDVKVALERGETIPALELVIERADKWRFGADPAVTERKFDLKPGDAATVRFSRTPTKADGDSGDWTPPAQIRP